MNWQPRRVLRLFNLDLNQGKNCPATSLRSDHGVFSAIFDKNERYPNIAITVDLLTTGIDVPKICNLVFMHRVKSRILLKMSLTNQLVHEVVVDRDFVNNCFANDGGFILTSG